MLLALVAAGCGGTDSSGNASAADGSCKPPDSPVITLAAYSNPYDAYFHTVLGSIYQKQENIDGALEEYSIAIGLDPANLEAYVNRGELLIRKGNFEYAASDFKNAMQLDPDGQNPSANRARALASVTAAALNAALSSAK